MSLTCSSLGDGVGRNPRKKRSNATRRLLPNGTATPALRSKKISQENRTLVCLDEAAFYLLPSVGYPWAPRGQPPILSEVCSRDHLSAISAITPQGKLYLHLQEYPFNGMDVVHFLCHLLGQIPGKLLILWDRAPIHINQYVRQLLASDHNQDLWLETFPAYAPELNPDEGIWHYLKNVELPNRCCPNIRHLRIEIRKAVGRLRHKTHIIKACFEHPQLLL